MADRRELRLTYDRVSDVLYVSFAPGVPAMGVEVEEGVIARLDPDSRELVGITIVGLTERAVEEAVGLSDIEGAFLAPALEPA